MIVNPFKQIVSWLDDYVWRDPVAGSSNINVSIHFIFRLVFVVTRDVFSGQRKLQASSLSFVTLMSFTPFLALVFSILKLIGVHKQLEPFLIDLMQPLGDQGLTLAMQVIAYIEKIDVGVLGVTGLLMLFYLSISLIRQFETVLNQIWRVDSGRSFILQILIYPLFIILGSVSFFGAITIMAFVMSSEIIQDVWQIQGLGTLGYLFNRTVPYLFVAIALTIFYLFIPDVKVKLKNALVGGVLASVLWQLTGAGFAYFVVASVQYQVLYSSFAIIILFMLWLYISWIIVLIGASLSYYLQNTQAISRYQKRIT